MLKSNSQIVNFFYSFLHKLNYLIIGDKPTFKKIKKAKELNIKTLSQEEWMKMLNKTS